MATFKCNQQRKPAKSWRADKPPRGAAPGPPPGTAPIHSTTPGHKEPGRKLLNTKGCRKSSSGCADTLTHAGMG